MAFTSPYIADLPHLVDPGPSNPFIPPPEGATFESGFQNAFPGFSGQNTWGQAQSPWAAPTSPHPSPWAAPSPANQFGGGGGGGGGGGFSSSYFDTQQPVTASPWFGGGGGGGAGAVSSPLVRSQSFGGHSPYHGLKRSHSLGSSSPSPWFRKSGPVAHRDDAYNDDNLARRPRDWRADYTPRSGVLEGLRQKFSRVDTQVKEITDKVKRSIHPLLQYSLSPTGYPPIYANVLTPFTTLALPSSGRLPNQLDFCQLASNPPADFIRITHPLLPWYIDVQNTQPNGITIGDVLTQIAEALSQPISARHFWNEALTTADRAALTHVFKERCGDDMVQVSQGVKQVDFLGGAVWLMGFVRKNGGMWEMVTDKSGNR